MATLDVLHTFDASGSCNWYKWNHVNVVGVITSSLSIDDLHFSPRVKVIVAVGFMLKIKVLSPAVKECCVQLQVSGSSHQCTQVHESCTETETERVGSRLQSCNLQATNSTLSLSLRPGWWRLEGSKYAVN
ncbi:hypothetical protein MPTK1_6g08930 [Marchantia polymorpha subsp. ruderalis]|uniref:Uncharacterized protein n=2 Tax=Marchantia polymorpha TaxID=3197 RepID=A0AAF6BQ26_MARPO|nr:hypothetical protein MARPO_0060s0026 [Marchantia polymorpha]BBN14110.1 hypothetical protein Mp_6g08930 [Marchantia polymorpha subsp. ruderalis]|eukprot:PTQ36933.1 hypothetical protein MARPO_0060s0026 [Marchantia polymorpha]